MTAKRVSELDALVIPAAEDLLLIIDDPSVDPISKKITFSNLTRSITSNTFVALSTLNVGNTSSNVSMTPSSIAVGGSGVNASITSTAIRIGNGTVNTVISSNTITVAGETFISLTTLKSVVSLSSDFNDYKSRIAAL